MPEREIQEFHFQLLMITTGQVLNLSRPHLELLLRVCKSPRHFSGGGNVQVCLLDINY
jgi:hypothetical protein